MEGTIVLYPGLAVSHFVPVMERAQVLLEHGRAVTVAFIDRPNKPPGLAAAVDHFVSSQPSISFHKLPPVAQPPPPSSGEDFIVAYYNLIRAHNGRLRSFLRSLPLQRVRALVIDVLSFPSTRSTSPASSACRRAFYPAGAAALAVYLQRPSMAAKIPTSFRELGDTPLEFFGVLPIPASHLSREMRERPVSDVYKAALSRWARVPDDTDGILFDTSSRWSHGRRELSATRASSPAGLCLCLPCSVSGRWLVEAAGARRRSASERHAFLRWLGGQPDRSVVYLCFGSAGVHREEQILEIATGLEMSGHRFLWVVQAPKNRDLVGLMPEGFSERTEGRGLVVTSWAPQVDVLGHASEGAFVMHCGWNSLQEAIVAGVPMVCWPLYVEQKMNKVFLVEEMRIGVEVVGWEEGFVSAGEVAAKVKLVMAESARGEELRERVAAHKAGAAVAWKDGGSSRAEIARFLSDVGSGGRTTSCRAARANFAGVTMHYEV